MRLEMLMKQKLATELRMAPHIIQSIEVLTLPALELQNFIQQQLEINPVLEITESEDEILSPEQEQDQDQESPDDPEKPLDEQSLNSFENLNREEWKEFYSRDYIKKRSDGETDKKQEAMQNTPDRPFSLQEFLFQKNYL